MKDIKGFEGLYAVTEDGHIWSYPREWRSGKSNALIKHGGKWLKSWLSGEKRGQYLTVELSKDGKHFSFPVHRLVALTYIPNPEDKPEVNHKDGKKLNNDVSNLEWSTESENSQHAVDTGLRVAPRGEEVHLAKLTEKQVLEIRASSSSDKEIALQFNVSRRNINEIKNRRTWKHI